MNDQFLCYNSGTPFRGHPDEMSPPLERPLDNVNLNINILISTPDERPPLLKGHFCGEKGVVLQEGFHCILWYNILITNLKLYMTWIVWDKSLNFHSFQLPRVQALLQWPYSLDNSMDPPHAGHMT